MRHRAFLKSTFWLLTLSAMAASQVFSNPTCEAASANLEEPPPPATANSSPELPPYWTQERTIEAQPESMAREGGEKNVIGSGTSEKQHTGGVPPKRDGQQQRAPASVPAI